MAVFPDRIVLKNSEETRAEIEAQIGTTGDSAITQGEIVIGVNDNDVRLYTKSANGDIVSLGSTSTNIVIISNDEPTVNNDGQPLSNGDLWFNPATGVLYVYDNGIWTAMIAGAPLEATLAGLSDVQIVSPQDQDILFYSAIENKWVNGEFEAGTVQSVAISGDNAIEVENSPITIEGTIDLSLSDTGVVAGSYTAANVVVDRQGRITAISNGSSGSNPLNSLDALNDVNTTGEETGDLLQLSATGFYRPRSISEILAGDNSEVGVIDVAYSTHELVGIDGFYADQAALEADGFTFIAGSIDKDSGVMNLTGIVPAVYLSTDYLGLGLTGINTIALDNNGPLMLSSGSTWSGGSSGFDLDDVPASIELFIAPWFSPDESRIAGWKEHAAYGTTWLIVRMDVKHQYYRESSGFPLEFWLGQNGQIRVQVGQPVGTQFDLIQVGANKQGIVSLGTTLATGEGVPTTGRSQTIYNVGSYAGAKLEDVTDVSDIDAQDGQVLAWSEADGAWKPQTVNGIPLSGGNIGFYNIETQLASTGACQFNSIGTSGILQKVESDLDAWVVLYSSSQARMDDSGRAYGVEPDAGSGVLAEYTLTGGVEQLASPGTTYFNSDSTPLGAIYAAVRSTAGVDVDATVTLSVYGMSGVNVIRGGTFGSGL